MSGSARRKRWDDNTHADVVFSQVIVNVVDAEFRAGGAVVALELFVEQVYVTCIRAHLYESMPPLRAGS